MASVHGSLREEVQVLRKRLVNLETAEADNEKLRKDQSKLRISMEGEKSQLELDFMNQLTGVARENALKLEELQGRLTESTKVNRALSEQLGDTATPEMLDFSMKVIEENHKKDMVHINDTHEDEVGRMQKQLSIVQSSRDELTQKLDDTTLKMEMKRKEVDALELQVKALFSNARDQNASASNSLQKLLKEAHEEKAKLKNIVKSLEGELSKKSSLHQNETRILKERLASQDSELNVKVTEINDTHEDEVGRMQKQLSIVQASRDELTQKLDDTTLKMEMKRKEVDSLELKVKALSSNAREQNASASNSLQKLLKEAHEEKAKLKNTVKSLEGDLSKKSSLHQNETRILKERLASQDSELNVKVAEIQRLESQINKSRMVSHEESGMKDVMKSLEQENYDMQETMKSLDKENYELKASRRKVHTEKQQQALSVTQLERTNQELNKKCQQLEQESEDLKNCLQNGKKEKDETKKLMDELSGRQSQVSTSSAPHRVFEPPEVKSLARNPLGSPKFNPHEKRTTQIIRRLEQNLKREGQMKQNMTASLKSRKQPEPETPGAVPLCYTADKRDEYLKGDVSDLEHKLDRERDLTSSLRKEITEMKASQARSFTSNIPAFTTRGTSKPTEEEEYTPVRNLVQNFELRMSQNTCQRIDDIALINSNDVDELKEALHYERQQVCELEDELTRQCEINFSLLKEITTLTTDTETSRTKHVNAFENRPTTDQKEMGRLASELSKLKSQLAQAEESKANLSKSYDKISSSDGKEIERLTAELSQLKSQISKAEASKLTILEPLELASSSDRKEVDRLKRELTQLQAKLDRVENEMKKLQDQSVLDQEELESRQRKIGDFQQNSLEAKRQIEENESRIGELVGELSKPTAKNFDDESRDDEIAGLNSYIAALQSTLLDADETKLALKREKEAASRLDALVQDQKTQLSFAEKKYKNLSGEISTDRVTDKEQMGSLTSQVESLVEELGKVTEHRDDLEEKDRMHHERFDFMRTEIDSKFDEFEKTHNADQEAIGRLHDQVKSLQQELQDTLVTVENLQSHLKEKENVEETVEELAKQNQQSVECQLNKLQTELTKTQVARAREEVDYGKKMQALEDMIDSMQVETGEALEEKETEFEELKRCIGDKDSMIERVIREKEQLVLSMNDMTSSRRNEIDELQVELMEMSTRAANQAREVQTLKLQLEDTSYRKEEVERLRSRTRELSEQLTSHGSRTNERNNLKVENSDLRKKLRDNSLALRVAEDKLRDLIADKGGSSKSTTVLRERNAALKFEVEKLTKKLRKLAERKHAAESSAVEATRFMI
jgi:chromosome segregation ATPase